MGAHDKPSIQKHLIGLLMGYSFPDTGAHQQMRYLRKTINNTLDAEREIRDYCVVMVYENGFSNLSQPLDRESLPT
ncbi:hypothetical protein CEXT_289711 [Caerostris extrusa]|uniref:Uncharacterized protein n=1 Tax=Caerostris extrusa TaxID=172846 RepID=A0AAV4VMW4_CAEEX|nr:hypothetical protein CEXT_289711 [Caerostris extrusa]